MTTPRVRSSKASLRRATEALESDGRAIAAVLGAERDAEHAVELARSAAEATLAQARQQSRAISDRADRRLRFVRTCFEQKTELAIEKLNQTHRNRERESQRSLADEARVNAAVQRVADWLLAPEEPES